MGALTVTSICCAHHFARAVDQFSVVVESDLPIPEARAKVVTNLVRALGKQGYAITDQTETTIDLQATWRHRLTWFFTIITFPLGLVFFLAFKRTSNITVLLSPRATGEGTAITISGEARRHVAKQVQSLS